MDLPRAAAGGSVRPSTHLPLNTEQTVTQALHLSAPLSGTRLLGKGKTEKKKHNNEEHADAKVLRPVFSLPSRRPHFGALPRSESEDAR